MTKNEHKAGWEKQAMKDVSDILRSQVKARFQTSDIQVGMLSSTGLNEKVTEITKYFSHLLTQKASEVVGAIESEKHRPEKTMADGQEYTIRLTEEKQQFNQGLDTAKEIVTRILK